MWPTRETCTRPGTLSASFGTHDEISQVSTVPTDAQNATILELSADMIPNPGAFVRMNFIFFRNRLLNLAVSLMRHRANRASTLYYQSEAKSHAGIWGNVANVGMLPVTTVANFQLESRSRPGRRSRGDRPTLRLGWTPVVPVGVHGRAGGGAAGSRGGVRSAWLSNLLSSRRGCATIR